MVNHIFRSKGVICVFESLRWNRFIILSMYASWEKLINLEVLSCSILRFSSQCDSPRSFILKISITSACWVPHPQCKSNIFHRLFNSFKLLSKHQKLLKNIFLNFSVFLLMFVRVSFHFFCSTYCTSILHPPL